MNRRSVLRFTLVLICAYHLILGLAAFSDEGTAKWLAEIIFGITLQLTPQLSYIIKLLGVYLMAFGLVAGVAATAPERFSTLLHLVVVLYALRIANKLIFSDLFTVAFAAAPERVWIDLVLLAAFGGTVAALRPSRAGNPAGRAKDL
jgi:hypothetical protein